MFGSTTLLIYSLEEVVLSFVRSMDSHSGDNFGMKELEDFDKTVIDTLAAATRGDGDEEKSQANQNLIAAATNILSNKKKYKGSYCIFQAV